MYAPRVRRSECERSLRVDGGPGPTGPESSKPRRDASSPKERPARAVLLSARELAVARLAVRGVPLKCIGAELGISVFTAATYLARVRRKVGQKSRWKLAASLSLRLPTFSELLDGRQVQRLDGAAIRIGDALLAGCSNKEIAAREMISPAVAARRVACVLRALGVRTRADLISLASKQIQLPCSKNPALPVGAERVIETGNSLQRTVPESIRSSAVARRERTS